ncbi:Leucine rich repeat [Phytophthora infestans]|uniref:Leucine rich repeat n=1 Tax=Phytophthora infestans TaxID=4787 RepID=A0A8S9VE44_PHYIN|nr:Leucine rich repeat [Phytophthora infestans]
MHSTKKTHNSFANVDSHISQVVAARTGIRGSSKRNPNQKPKKHQPDGHDALKMELRANGELMEQRLATAVRTKRLDLSLPRNALVSSVYIQHFQILPATIIEHVNRGHHLTELWLTNHRLGSLPADISVFSKLRVLGLAGNALTALPEELNQLSDLEALYLEKNQLRTVPIKVTFPPKLRELRLDYNQLTSFPTQITKLRLLNRLGLSHNQLKAVPEQIHRLRNLVELDLDYNRIDCGLPDGVAELQRLERIGLEGNFLSEKPAVLDRLPVLSYIRLSGNRAKQFLSTDKSIDTGASRRFVAVPKRHDGYFQCIQSSTKIHENEDGDIFEHNQNRRILDGLVPCRDQNILNALTYS